MKRVVIAATLMAVLLSGCGQKEPEFQEVDGPLIMDNILQEVEGVEANADELMATDTSNMTQFEMNELAGQEYQLWDDELNSLWERIIEKVPEENKDKLVQEQKEWIKRKEGNAEAAAIENGGGSLAPLLRDSRAAELTRVRVYYLAQILADYESEYFEVPQDIQRELAKADYPVDEVFEYLEGQWVFDTDTGACVGVERSSESAYGVDDSNWTVWITGGDQFSDKDVFGYVHDCIVLHKADSEESGYTVISRYDNTFSYWYGKSVDDLLNGAMLDEISVSLGEAEAPDWDALLAGNATFINEEGKEISINDIPDAEEPMYTFADVDNDGEDELCYRTRVELYVIDHNSDGFSVLYTGTANYDFPVATDELHGVFYHYDGAAPEHDIYMFREINDVGAVISEKYSSRYDANEDGIFDESDMYFLDENEEQAVDYETWMNSDENPMMDDPQIDWVKK